MAYSIEETAAGIYTKLVPLRNNYLRRAEQCAALTIPMLIPRNSEMRGYTVQQEFDTPRQGIGARGVNHLASRLLLTLFPPTSSFFKYKIDPFALDKLAQQSAAVGANSQQVQAEVMATLAQMEDSVAMVVNTEGMRVPAAEILKHLIVGGNALRYLPDSGGMQFFPLAQYVCVRDPEGDQVIEVVLREVVARVSLPEDVQKLVAETEDKPTNMEGPSFVGPTGNTEDKVRIFTRQCLVSKNKYEYWQELENGKEIPGTHAKYPVGSEPLQPLRWTKVPGEAYGRGLVEEHKGSLLNLEGFMQALVEGGLAAARVVGLVLPNSQTRPQDLNDANNGEFVVGRKDDVTFLQLEKYADFKVSMEMAQSEQKNLENVFLLNSSVIRDAERVTAEEVRYAAQELETVLGGTYTILAQEFQLPLAKHISQRLQRAGEIPQFPKQLQNKIKPVIVVGVDALGRNQELERLRSAFGMLTGIFGPQVVASLANLSPTATYVLAMSGVSVKGLVKSADEIAQAQQQQQQMEMMHNVVKQGTAPAIKAVSDATQQQNQQAQPAQGQQ